MVGPSTRPANAPGTLARRGCSCTASSANAASGAAPSMHRASPGRHERSRSRRRSRLTALRASSRHRTRERSVRVSSSAARRRSRRRRSATRRRTARQRRRPHAAMWTACSRGRGWSARRPSRAALLTLVAVLPPAAARRARAVARTAGCRSAATPRVERAPASRHRRWCESTDEEPPGRRRHPSQDEPCRGALARGDGDADGAGLADASRPRTRPRRRTDAVADWSPRIRSASGRSCRTHARLATDSGPPSRRPSIAQREQQAATVDPLSASADDAARPMTAALERTGYWNMLETASTPSPWALDRRAPPGRALAGRCRKRRDASKAWAPTCAYDEARSRRDTISPEPRDLAWTSGARVPDLGEYPYNDYGACAVARMSDGEEVSPTDGAERAVDSKLELVVLGGHGHARASRRRRRRGRRRPRDASTLEVGVGRRTGGRWRAGGGDLDIQPTSQSNTVSPPRPPDDDHRGVTEGATRRRRHRSAHAAASDAHLCDRRQRRRRRRRTPQAPRGFARRPGVVQRNGHERTGLVGGHGRTRIVRCTPLFFQMGPRERGGAPERR